MVEMWKNYRPLVPDKYQCDTLYAKPAVYVMKMVKDEKVYRAETGGIDGQKILDVKGDY